MPGSLEGAAAIAVDLVGAVGCGAGITQTVADYNKVLADLASSNATSYSSDLGTFEGDLFSTVFGCAIGGIGGGFDIGSY